MTRAEPQVRVNVKYNHVDSKATYLVSSDTRLMLNDLSPYELHELYHPSLINIHVYT